MIGGLSPMGTAMVRHMNLLSPVFVGIIGQRAEQMRSMESHRKQRRRSPQGITLSNLSGVGSGVPDRPAAQKLISELGT